MRGLALLANALATGAALVVLITIFGPMSGAHFNPGVTFYFAPARRNRLGQRHGSMWWRNWPRAIAGRVAGACDVRHAGAGGLAQAARWRGRNGWPNCRHLRPAGDHCRRGRALRPRPPRSLVGLYITAAYWFTASTSFANPAVTLARALTDILRRHRARAACRDSSWRRSPPRWQALWFWAGFSTRRKNNLTRQGGNRCRGQGHRRPPNWRFAARGHVMTLDRRLLLGSLAALGGCAAPPGCRPGPRRPPPPLAPIRAHPDRLFDITVCLRPFRAAGPRLDAETIGDALVVHNYGHGGSGWSLSWGSAHAWRCGRRMAGSPREIAVIGCGALGLTAAILAQRAGVAGDDLCKELLPAGALGPRHRQLDARQPHRPEPRPPARLSPRCGRRWRAPAGKTYRDYLGLPGDPVVFRDRYTLSDVPFGAKPLPEPPGALDFAEYGDRIADLDAAQCRSAARRHSVPHQVCAAQFQPAVQHPRLCPHADDRLPPGRRQDRDARIPRPGRVRHAAAEGGDQLPRLWRARPDARTRASCRCAARSAG